MIELIKSLNKARSEFSEITKSGVGIHNNAFMSWADISKGCTHALNTNGIVPIQTPIVVDGAVGIKTILFHVSGEKLEFEFVPPKNITMGKNGIHGLGSTITYLTRYHMKAIFLLSEKKDDDDAADAMYSEKQQEVIKQENKPQKKIKDHPEINQIKADCELWGIPWADDWGERSEGMFGALRKHVDKLISEKQSIDPMPDYMKT